MALAHFRILIHGFLNKVPDIVPEKYPLIILDIKSTFCMAKSGRDTKHTRHIARRVLRTLKNENFTRLIGMKEVCNWQTLQLRMLLRMAEIP